MYRRMNPDDPPYDAGGRGDRHSRVSYSEAPSFCDRVCKSLGSSAAGAVLICVSVLIIFYNEGRAVQTAKSLDEGLRNVYEVKSISTPFQELDGKLVHIQGPLTCPQMLRDNDYGVAISAVKLKREVTMYQWVEHVSSSERKVEDGQIETTKTYSYDKEWRSEVIHSMSFDSTHHKNPGEFPVQSKTSTSESVLIGGYHLSQTLIEKVGNYRELSPPADSLTSLGSSDVQLFGGAFYHGRNPRAPEVGDLKVKFMFAGLCDESSHGRPDSGSVIAKQEGSNLRAYKTDAGDSLEMFYQGHFSAQEMFGKEQSANTTLTWLLRFVGWLLSFAGFFLLTRIITTLVDWIPIVRNLVQLGVFSMNVCLSSSLSLVVIAIGWVAYRPLFGLAAFAVAAVPVFLPGILGFGRGTRYRAV